MLIDTHVLLWYLAGDRKRIARSLQKRIEGEGTMVSAVSIWEIAIKSALGKLDAPDDLPARIVQFGFEVISVTSDHAWRVRTLPLHHRDPFDRLLIAQAQAERVAILTADPSFADYDVPVVSPAA